MSSRFRIHGDLSRNYGREWKRWRKAYHLTQADVASILSMCLRSIVNIEQGVHRPNQTSRRKMEELQKRYREADSELWADPLKRSDVNSPSFGM